MASSESFHYPPGQHYTCTQCGRSCGMFLEVPIEERSERRLDDEDLAALMPPEIADLPPFHESPVADDRRVIRRHEGTCAFQCEDKLCGIHKALGFEKKPQTCRDFPFRFVDSPRGVYVGLSYACTAVQANTGAAVSARRAELEGEYPVANSRRRASRPVRLTSRHEISWDAYLGLEEDFDFLLREENMPVAEAIRAQATYLDIFTTFIREIRGDSPAKPAVPPEGNSRFEEDSGTSPDREVIETLRRRFIKGDAAELRRIAGRARGSPALQRAFLGLITAFRQNLYVKGNRPGRVQAAARISRHYIKHAMKIGRIELDAVGRPFRHSDLRRIVFVPDEIPAQAELLRRFLRHRLFRKDLLLDESVWLGHRFMAMQFALLRWHAVGRAAADGAPAVLMPHLEEAIRDVELHYVFHTTFGQLFEKFPMLGMILDSITRRPLFVPSMTVQPR